MGLRSRLDLRATASPPDYVLLMNRSVLTGLVAIAVSLAACGDDAGSDETSGETPVSVTDSGSDTTPGAEPGQGSGFAGTGQAIIRILSPGGAADSALEYTVDGTCETSGADITFTSPGDPSFTIGITTSGAPAVGNFNSPSDGVGFLVGSRAESEVVVTIGDGTFTIAGDFDVLDGSVIDGVVEVTCTG